MTFFTSPHCFAEISRSRAQVESGYVVEKPAPVINLSMAIPFVEDAVEPKKVMGASGPMSLGSVGHPHACSEPCKYAWKKNGCKDDEGARPRSSQGRALHARSEAM